MLLCFASSGLLKAEERSSASTDFKVFAEKLITTKEKNIGEQYEMLFSQSTVYIIERNVCHIRKLLSVSSATMRKKDFDHLLYPTHRKERKTESGHESWVFPHREMQSRRKWGEQSWKDDKPPAAATHDRKLTCKNKTRTAKASLARSMVSALSRQEWKLSRQRQKMTRTVHQHPVL